MCHRPGYLTTCSSAEVTASSSAKVWPRGGAGRPAAPIRQPREGRQRGVQEPAEPDALARASRADPRSSDSFRAPGAGLNTQVTSVIELFEQVTALLCELCGDETLPLEDQLRAAVDTIWCPVASCDCVLGLAALPDRQALVHDAATLWAVANRGVRAAMIQVIAWVGLLESSHHTPRF